uniref:Ig-like domain-containing protein n=1 Tax=Neogobius melanostomus TaxID=47308 RepID=A0A8C6UC06_9GOBI
MDSDLNLNSHIKAITSSAFYHLKNIAKIRGIVSKPDLERLIHAFVSSRLDYCNGLLTGLSKRAVRQLQNIQNAAARVLTRTRKYDHISPVLRSLHWLPHKCSVNHIGRDCCNDFKSYCTFNQVISGLKHYWPLMTHNCYATVSLGVSLYDSAGVLQVTWQRLYEDNSIENLATYNKRFGEQVNNPYVGKIVFTEASLRSTSITVKNLTWTDESCYVCSFNAYPQGSKRHQTFKTQVYAPIDDPKEENMKVTFSCTATGKPAPKIQWEYHHASVVEQSETPVLTNDDHTLTSSRNITLQASLDWDGHVDCVINPGTRGEKRETIIFTRKTEQTENGRSIFIYHSLTVFFLALVKTFG